MPRGFEIAGWVAAVIVVAIMGVIALHGPWHKVNKGPSAISTYHGTIAMVTITNNPKTVGQYNPATVTVHVGQEIAFKNESSNIHTVTSQSQSYSFDSGDIATGGAAWRYIFSKPGTYHYYCIYHPYMHGTIVVQQ